jgi:hypothetical protein
MVMNFKKINWPPVGAIPTYFPFNPLSPELNPICYLLALLAHDFLHVSRRRVKSLTLRLLMSQQRPLPDKDSAAWSWFFSVPEYVKSNNKPYPKLISTLPECVRY